MKTKIDLIEKKLNREIEDRRKDMYDCAVKLLTERGKVDSDQDLVFRKEVIPFVKDDL